MRKSFLTCITALCLSGCDFTPMLAKNDNDLAESGSRLVVESENKDGSSYVIQMLRLRLKNSLSNIGLSKSYKTFVRIKEEAGSLAYAADATSTRSMMRMSAQIIISCNGKTVYETKLNGVTSYAQNTNDEFVNQSAVNGAQERLIESLSIDISREIQKFVKTNANS